MKISNCVLVSLNISNWDANTQDRRISAEVAQAHSVQDQRLCRLRKSLLPKSEEMKKLFSVMRAARTFHYENTHTWMHDGPRILPTQNFDAYMAKMRALKSEFESAVIDFVNQYDAIRANAKQVLGSLYNEEDYPQVSTLRGRYSFDIKIQPMPASDGLLQLGLEPEDAEEFRRKLEADMAETMQRANRRLWEDLYSRIERLYAKLCDDKSHVREETIEAVRNLADLLPKMNITNDTRLDALAQKLQASLKGLSANKLKTDDSVRQKAMEDTRNVFNVMQAFMSPNSGSQGLSREAA